MRSIRHTPYRDKARAGWGTKTSLTVTILIANKHNQEAQRNNSKSLLLCDRNNRETYVNTARAEERYSPEDAHHCRGFKPYKSCPLLRYNWNQPPNSILLHSSCSANPTTPPPLHTLPLSHTVKPVSSLVPHSSSFTVIEPRSCFLLQVTTEIPTSVRLRRSEGGGWQKAPRGQKRREEVGWRKRGAGERSKWGKKNKQKKHYKLCWWVFKYICMKQQAVSAISFSGKKYGEAGSFSPFIFSSNTRLHSLGSLLVPARQADAQRK